MTKGEMIARYKDLPPEERRVIDRWVQGNAVLASVFAIGLLAMALGGLAPLGPATAIAKSDATGEFSASAKRLKPIEGSSVYELMIHRAPHQLPTEHYAEPF
jgi:hypothetical protein